MLGLLLLVIGLWARREDIIGPPRPIRTLEPLTLSLTPPAPDPRERIVGRWVAANNHEMILELEATTGPGLQGVSVFVLSPENLSGSYMPSGNRYVCPSGIPGGPSVCLALMDGGDLILTTEGTDEEWKRAKGHVAYWRMTRRFVRPGLTDPESMLRHYYSLIDADQLEDAYKLRSQRSRSKTSLASFQKTWLNNNSIDLDAFVFVNRSGSAVTAKIRLIADDTNLKTGVACTTPYAGTVRLVFEDGSWRYDGGDFNEETRGSSNSQ